MRSRILRARSRDSLSGPSVPSPSLTTSWIHYNSRNLHELCILNRFFADIKVGCITIRFCRHHAPVFQWKRKLQFARIVYELCQLQKLIPKYMTKEVSRARHLRHECVLSASPGICHAGSPLTLSIRRMSHPLHERPPHHQMKVKVLQSHSCIM